MTWEEYLYREHSRETIARWARELRYFRFCRAYGGHQNDGDRLLVALSDPDLDPDMFQPAAPTIRNGRLELWLSDTYYVTESVVDAAKEIERRLPGGIVIDPPLDDEHCVCPKYYPEIWA
ncbi:hypothetical protein [Kibdelosporangium aridum]|uniref:Uncharacterized protein n=1 Tax=Kibdelosporangium aridum TaxID=2030 RepID=A0A1W2CSI2_KIBAR|nr:hypothetical protein [Kibdelosporangium aridum]SMC88171.1 hypothetical protein SAMN05661093_02407 [Kibdelosporangium aridum]